MASNTAFPSPANSEGGPRCKAQQAVRSWSRGPSPSSPPARPGPTALGPFPWNPFLEKHAQTLFIASSLFHRAVSSSEYNSQLS